MGTLDFLYIFSIIFDFPSISFQPPPIMFVTPSHPTPPLNLPPPPYTPSQPTLPLNLPPPPYTPSQPTLPLTIFLFMSPPLTLPPPPYTPSQPTLPLNLFLFMSPLSPSPYSSFFILMSPPLTLFFVTPPHLILIYVTPLSLFLFMSPPLPLSLFLFMSPPLPLSLFLFMLPLLFCSCLQAGQGLNLGLGDAQQLAESVSRALATGQDIGSYEVPCASYIPCFGLI